MFVRDDLDHQQLTDNHRTVLESEYRRVAGELYPAKMCYATGLSSAFAYQPLGVDQLEIVFYMVLLTCSLGGAVAVIGERFTRLLSSGREKRKIERSNVWHGFPEQLSAQSRELLFDLKRFIETENPTSLQILGYVNHNLMQ